MLFRSRTVGLAKVGSVLHAMEDRLDLVDTGEQLARIRAAVIGTMDGVRVTLERCQADFQSGGAIEQGAGSPIAANAQPFPAHQQSPVDEVEQAEPAPAGLDLAALEELERQFTCTDSTQQPAPGQLAEPTVPADKIDAAVPPAAAAASAAAGHQASGATGSVRIGVQVAASIGMQSAEAFMLSEQARGHVAQTARSVGDLADNIRRMGLVLRELEQISDGGIASTSGAAEIGRAHV